MLPSTVNETSPTVTNLHQPLLWSLAFHLVLGGAVVFYLGMDSRNKEHAANALVVQIQAKPSPTLTKTPAAKTIATATTPARSIIATSIPSATPIPTQPGPVKPIALTPESQNSVSENVTQTVVATTTTNTSETSEPEQPPLFDAAYLQNPQPDYPLFARKRNQQGTVLLRVQVSIDGKADSVNIAKSSGITALDEAAQKTVKQWRFVPAHRGELAVSAWVVVPIMFKLS